MDQSTFEATLLPLAMNTYSIQPALNFTLNFLDGGFSGLATTSIADSRSGFPGEAYHAHCVVDVDTRAHPFPGLAGRCGRLSSHIFGTQCQRNFDGHYARFPGERSPILNETSIDLWFTFVRETSGVRDPVLDFLIGPNDPTWKSALMFTRSGERIAIVGCYEVDAVERLGIFDTALHQG